MYNVMFSHAVGPLLCEHGYSTESVVLRMRDLCPPRRVIVYTSYFTFYSKSMKDFETFIYYPKYKEELSKASIQVRTAQSVQSSYWKPRHKQGGDSTNTFRVLKSQSNRSRITTFRRFFILLMTKAPAVVTFQLKLTIDLNILKFYSANTIEHKRDFKFYSTNVYHRILPVTLPFVFDTS